MVCRAPRYCEKVVRALFADHDVSNGASVICEGSRGVHHDADVVHRCCVALYKKFAQSVSKIADNLEEIFEPYKLKTCNKVSLEHACDG